MIVPILTNYDWIMAYIKILFFAALMFAPRFLDPGGCDNFSVDNESSYGIGTVTVTGLGTSVPIAVSDTGIFSDTVCFVPVAVVINGQVALYPDTTAVTLDGGSAVQVTWQSTQIVNVNDKELQDGRRS
jgi:hypothetical protein